MTKRQTLAYRFLLTMRSTFLPMEELDANRVRVTGDPDDPKIRRALDATRGLMQVPMEIDLEDGAFVVTLARPNRGSPSSPDR